MGIMAEFSESIAEMDKEIEWLKKIPVCPYINGYSIIKLLQDISVSMLKQATSESFDSGPKKNELMAGAAVCISISKKLVTSFYDDRKKIEQEGISDSAIVWMPMSEC